ncbi:BTB domain and CNC -like protein 1, partial [Chelydra serpentina]
MFSLCPKYRKFQKAFGSDRVHTAEIGSSIKDDQVTSATSIHQSESFNDAIQKAQECTAVQLVSQCEETQVEMEEGEEEVEKEEELKRESVTQSISCHMEKTDAASLPQNSSVASHELYSAPFLNAYEQYSNLNFSSMQNTVVVEKTVTGTVVRNDKPVSENQDDSLLKSDLCAREDTSITSTSDRSSVEREVAEHLAKGFWSDIYSTEAACQMRLSPATAKECSEPVFSGKKSECPWLGISL